TGPAAVPAPNVGGAPGVGDVAGGDEGCGWLRHAAAPTRNPSGAATRNWRRVFMRGDRIDRLRLLRTFEQSAVDGLAEDVTRDRFHHVGPRLERVGGRLHVDFRVEGVELEHVVMARAVGGRARSAIHLTGGADLIAAVGELRSLWDAFGQAGRGGGNVPH